MNGIKYWMLNSIEIGNLNLLKKDYGVEGGRGGSARGETTAVSSETFIEG